MRRVGKLYTCTIQFYNIQTKKVDFKKRPVLIIAKADDGDYNVLPVSSISDKSRIDVDYDIPISKTNYPRLSLSVDCYVRVNKQTIINRNNISKEISDLKNEYSHLYKSIISKWFEYNEKINKTEQN